MEADLKNELLSIASVKDVELVAAKVLVRLNQVAKLYGDEDARFTIKVYAMKEGLLDYYDHKGFVAFRKQENSSLVSFQLDVHGFTFRLHRMYWARRTPGMFRKKDVERLSNKVGDWDRDRLKMLRVLETLYARMGLSALPRKTMFH